MNANTKNGEHVRWFRLQGTLHFFVAVALAGLPFVVSELLMDMFFFTGHSWVHRPESGVKEFFLSSPYWSSYRAGLSVGLLPSVLAAASTVGLWSRRDWGRHLALAFHGLVAFLAFAVMLLNLPGLAIGGGGGPDSLAGVGFAISAMIVGGASCVLVLSFGYVVYMARPAICKRFRESGWHRPLGFVVVMSAAAVATEVVVNRLSVYDGEAKFQGKSTGYWLAKLASSDTATRRSAVEELGKNRDSVPVICEIYRGKPVRGPMRRYPDKIQRVYWSRAHRAPEIHRTNMIGEPLTLGLAKLLQDSDPDICRGAIRSLSSLCPKDPLAVTTLIEALQHSDASVRGSAVIAMSTMDKEMQKRVLPQLVEASNDPQLSRDSRGWARRAIRQVESVSVASLVEKLNSDKSKERGLAAWRLGLLGEEAAPAVPALIAALSDPVSDVRQKAATALGQIGPSAKTAVPALIQTLEDPSEWPRNSSAVALGKIGSAATAAVPGLTRALQDESVYVRVSAAFALVDIGNQIDLALPILREALKERGALNDKKRTRILEMIEAESPTGGGESSARRHE